MSDFSTFTAKFYLVYKSNNWYNDPKDPYPILWVNSKYGYNIL